MVTVEHEGVSRGCAGKSKPQNIVFSHCFVLSAGTVLLHDN